MCSESHDIVSADPFGPASPLRKEMEVFARGAHLQFLLDLHARVQRFFFILIAERTVEVKRSTVGRALG